MSAAVAAPLLREDDRGIPRSLPLLAALVEAEARSCAAAAAAASQPADSDLIRAFRGGAAPNVRIRIFMERIHLLTRSVPARRGMVRIDGTAFVLVGIYLTRFIPSAAGREAGILIEPATAHRLVAVAVLLAAKFGGHPPRKWAGVFQDSSEGPLPACDRLPPVRRQRGVRLLLQDPGAGASGANHCCRLRQQEEAD
ncbi:unnamed protein product [Urochloa humidicola]